MTMTRQQLKAVIDRQLVTQRVLYRVDDTTTVDGCRRAILAAVDDWAAGEFAGPDDIPGPGPTSERPVAVIRFRKLTPWALRRFRKQLARALGTTTGGAR